ncbi:hypothetical protein [Candidatus Avelusimicrobium aviculae]|uniref:hypothetical protein n=1 Tax=Candidatus Avelusimicrobium aviculae TaxID=3416206 RepID=UPI003D12AE4C
MKKHYLLISLFSCLALPAWALPDDDSNQTLTYAGETVSGSTEIVAGHGQQNANGNTVIITGSTIQDNNSPLHNAQVVGGWAVYNSANDNTITISNSTVNRNIVAGQSTFGLQANNNEVSITGSQVNKDAPLEAVTTLTGYQAEHRYDEQDGDVYVLSSMATDRVQAAGDLAPEASLYTIYGGTISNGEASGNKIIITDSQNGIGNNLVSAYSLYLAGSHLEGNSIQVSNSAVSGLIVGATSYAANWETSITDPLTNNNNSVSVSSSQVNDVIGAFGGLTTNGNSILLTGSTADNLYGVSFGQNIFYAGGQPQTIENTADNNSVRLYNASTVTGNIYGAQSHSVQARGNLVEIADGSSAQGNVYGTHISNARVQVNDTTVSWNTVQTAAENNTLTITGATAGNSTAEIAGAKNLSGWANSNRVTLTAATATAATLAGGWAAHERQTLTAQGQQDLAIGYQADTNTLSATESQINANVYGGLVSQQDDINPNGVTDTTLSTAWANLVHLDSSTLTGNAYGGAALGDYTSANYNRLWLTDSQVNGSVYGGLAEGTNSTAGWNQVIINNSSVTGDVYAASAAQGGNNTVTLAGKSDISGTVYGGEGGNNQLTLLNFQSAQELNVSGFDRPYIISGADTSVTFAQDVAQADVYVQGTNDVNGHIMIRTPDENSSFLLHSVDSGVYTYALTPEQQADGWTAWLLSGGFSSQRAETYVQTAMAALALANAGDGLLSEALNNAVQSGQETGTFLQSSYENATHETGSGIRLHATTVLAGLYTQTADWLGGLYARYAYGDYNTYPVHSDSYASSWAGGLFGAWNGTENLRLLADARVGWQTTSYGGSYQTGASFDYESVFTSLQTAAQYAFIPSLWADARLRWTHIQGKDLTDNLGEEIYLSGSDSLLGALGVNFQPEFLAFGYFAPQIKAELLHEFNGQGLAEVENHRLDGVSLRGTTGRATLAINYNNEAKGLLANLSGFVEGGQMEGWGVKAQGALRF